MAYERSLIAAKPDDEQVTTLVNSTKGELSPELILKSSYVVDFLGLANGFSESELEDAVVEQLERFIMELGQDFAWQDGYGAFSVSNSHVDAVAAYIKGQEEHHKKVSFQDEFRKICELYNAGLDERYAWD